MLYLIRKLDKSAAAKLLCCSIADRYIVHGLPRYMLPGRAEKYSLERQYLSSADMLLSYVCGVGRHLFHSQAT